MSSPAAAASASTFPVDAAADHSREAACYVSFALAVRAATPPYLNRLQNLNLRPVPLALQQPPPPADALLQQVPQRPDTIAPHNAARFLRAALTLQLQRIAVFNNWHFVS